MAKRSPILGYNHNVRYRGLVFHVQTEDSGVMSPHLFTHLFHAGVIVSTRKLVYDAGSAEDAIKSLMQAQHKAVLKDLRRGVFDDKIDQYLNGTEGLLPRGVGVEPEDRPSQPELEDDGKTRRDQRPLTGRAPTAERKSGAATVRSALSEPPPPVGDGIDGPTDLDQLRTKPNVRAAEEPSQPEIEIQLELDEPDDQPIAARGTNSGRRIPRDTDVNLPRPGFDDHTRPTIDVSALSDGIPGILAARHRPGESVPPLPPPPTPGTLPNARPASAVNASALPPGRPITRPPQRPAITPPQVLARPLVEPGKRPGDSDAVEVYAPAPPSTEPPPGERPSGAYAQHRKQSVKMPAITDAPVPPTRPGSGSAPIPPGLHRPARQSSSPAPPTTTQPLPRPPIPTPRAPDPTLPVGSGQRSRTPTPSRTSGTAPAAARTPSPSAGVVMTRPAVIVGAPVKPAQPRVRKAREDEGRGFGQGLISEKSLDEVILAYLSEDAEENK